MSAPPPITTTQLSSSFASQHTLLPIPSPTFLTSILSASTSTRSTLASLTATARHRLLNTDLTTPSLLSPSTPSLPADIANVQVASTSLPHDVFVQVLEIEDLSKSKWEQIEALESERKGETTKGREVIRVVATPAGDNDLGSAASTQAVGSSGAGQGQSSKGPFKLLLQDWKGNKVYAFELKKVEKIGYPPTVGIGCKIVLKKGAKVARGMVLLEPSSMAVVGGKVELLDKAWTEGREKNLREKVKKEAEENEVSAGKGGRR